MAPGQHPRAFGRRIVNQRGNCAWPPRIGERPHAGVCRKPVPGRDRFGALGKPCDKPVVDRLLHIKPRGRDADLPGVAELLRDHQIKRLFQIAVSEHQHRRVSAQFHRYPLKPIGGQPHQMPPDRD